MMAGIVLVSGLPAATSPRAAHRWFLSIDGGGDRMEENNEKYEKGAEVV
jgi:hypothetical protein